MILVAAIPAAADTFFYDGVHYNYRVLDVPDLDQRRGADPANGIPALPNNGGMYCVPTSIVNWLGYLANHGYPALDPGPGNWQVSPPANLTQYNHITGTLFVIGILMHTSATKGTGGVKPYLQDYLDSNYPGQFMVIAVGADKDWSPRARDAALMALSDGLVMVAMGWYTEADVSPIHIRSGGHMVTLSGAEDDDVARDLKFNDPAAPNDNMLTTQSAFMATPTLYHAEDAIYCGGLDDQNFPKNCYERTQDRLEYTGSGYLDSYTAIVPKYGLSYSLGELILIRPISLSGRHASVQRIPVGGLIADVAVHPLRTSQPFIVAGRNSISKVDLITGEVQPFIERANTPRRLVYGGTDEALYVLQDDAIVMYDRNARATASIALRTPIDAIAFDEKNNRLVGISRRESALFVYDSALRRELRFELPPGLLNRGDRATLTINPTNGEIWSFNEGAQLAVRITLSDTGKARTVAVPLPRGTSMPQSIHVDERGTLFVVVDGHIVPIDASGNVVRSSRFFGMPAGAGLQISRPYTNWNDRMTGPGWDNVLPEDAVRGVSGR